ncbi:MAG TPA: extracellular solute-binding protein [Terriglobales bacterium]|nr:extracellular solute-binding protein [Terriglobales bacterium]
MLYAGSLAAVMENGIGPDFAKATGDQYRGEAQGSMGAARMIRDGLRQPDIFISADPLVNQTILMGTANGNHVKWFMTLASSQLVLAYNPRSRFASKFQDAQGGKIPWYQALATQGVRFGRGDPSIDPKGYRTLFMFRLAADFYHRPELVKLIGDPMNPDQVLPEIVLLARLESGQFDAAIFYKHEAVAHRLPFISLPSEINLGDPHLASLYAKESYVTPKGEEVHGAPIIFTITIPDTVKNVEAALAFASFVLSSNQLWEQYGFGNVPHQVGGERAEVPSSLRKYDEGSFRP